MAHGGHFGRAHAVTSPPRGRLFFNVHILTNNPDGLKGEVAIFTTSTFSPPKHFFLYKCPAPLQISFPSHLPFLLPSPNSTTLSPLTTPWLCNCGNRSLPTATYRTPKWCLNFSSPSKWVTYRMSRYFPTPNTDAMKSISFSQG